MAVNACDFTKQQSFGMRPKCAFTLPSPGAGDLAWTRLASSLGDAGVAGGGGGGEALLVWLQGVGFNPDPLEQQTIKAPHKNKIKQQPD